MTRDGIPAHVLQRHGRASTRVSSRGDEMFRVRGRDGARDGDDLARRLAVAQRLMPTTRPSGVGAHTESHAAATSS